MAQDQRQQGGSGSCTSPALHLVTLVYIEAERTNVHHKNAT